MSKAHHARADEPHRQRKWKPLLVIALFAIAALAPAILWGVPASRDLQHHFRLALAYKESFSQYNFYPGWLAEANNGYGDVSLRFYPPGLGFLLAGMRTLIESWYATALIAFTLLTLTGGVGVYLWAGNFYDPRIAMWAGVIYIFMPYRINELYQSSLLAEYAAAAVLPFVFAFAEKVCREGGRRNVAGLAASYALLVLTNLPMTIIGSYALAVYVILRVDRKNLWPALARFAGAMALGLAASACFWVTVVAELSWLRPDNETAFSRVNFIFASFRPHQGDTNIWYGNLVVLATLALTLPALILFRRDASKPKVGFQSLAILAGFSFLMSTVISLPLWEILPRLKDVQLPWRWLAVTSAACAVLAAASIPRWKEIAQSNRRPLALLAAGCVFASLAFTSHPIREAKYISASKLEQVVTTTQGLPSIGPWYPKWVAEKFEVMPQQVSAGDRTITVSTWDSERRVFQVTAGAATDARVHTFYYPHWIASAGGRPLATRPDQDGTLLVSLPAEAATVDLSFHEPLRSKISMIVSLLGTVMILLLVVPARKRKR
jgi:6-pyruvoyl-tetrahydropterin synthase related domain